MEQFREGHINILVATDLAARGIDVKEISYVVNYHLPEMNLTCTVAEEQQEQEQGTFINGTTRRRGARNCDFENLGIKFTEFKTNA
jgi:ATP-dependent RNA helicase DeaD